MRLINANTTTTVKPQEISVRQLGHEPLLAGTTATFECLALGSRPPATIHWLFQGVRHEPPTTGEQLEANAIALKRSG